MLIDKLAPKQLEENPLWLVVLCDLMTNLMLFFMILFAFIQLDADMEDRHIERFRDGFVDIRWFEQKDFQKAQKPVKRVQEAVERLQEREAIVALEELIGTRRLRAGLELTTKEIRVKLPDPALFAVGRAELSDQAKKNLGDLAAVISRMPETLIVVEGHTDNIPVGRKSPYESNWHLAAARANAVAQFLVSNGIAASRIVIAGYGDLKPIAPNDTREGRALNRRIEIKVFRKTEEDK